MVHPLQVDAITVRLLHSDALAPPPPTACKSVLLSSSAAERDVFTLLSPWPLTHSVSGECLAALLHLTNTHTPTPTAEVTLSLPSAGAERSACKRNLRALSPLLSSPSPPHPPPTCWAQRLTTISRVPRVGGSTVVCTVDYTLSHLPAHVLPALVPPSGRLHIQ